MVARQRELAAALGDEFPVAAALLETYEWRLALLEETFQRRGSGASIVDSFTNCDEPVDAINPMPDYEDQMHAVARVVEILREGGYHCEVAEETLH
jgi:hypothetical protein